MVTLREACRHVRSKNAGPFWVTIDLFFTNTVGLERYIDNKLLSSANIALLYNAEASFVKRVAVPTLSVLKISFPRPNPQGWEGERDMHQGQSYVRLLDIELDDNSGML